MLWAEVTEIVNSQPMNWPQAFATAIGAIAAAFVLCTIIRRG